MNPDLHRLMFSLMKHPGLCMRSKTEHYPPWCCNIWAAPRVAAFDRDRLGINSLYDFDLSAPVLGSHYTSIT